MHSAKPGVLRVPIEMMNEEDGARCAPLAPLQPWRLAEAEAQFLGKLPLRHYRQPLNSQEMQSGSEHWPFPRVAAAIPSYNSFWGNRSFCREVVGCLYKDDLTMYRRTCTDPASPLLQCAAYRRACARELARLHDVCGLTTE